MNGVSKAAGPGNPLERVEAIAHLIEAAASGNEQTRRIDAAVIDALHAARLFRMLLPKAYGGEQCAPPDFFRAIEAVAKRDASTAWCLCQANGCAMAAPYLSPQVAQEIWGRDPRAAVAWGPPFKSEAQPVDGGWIVTGRWSFGSGMRHATWLGLQCTVADEGPGDGRMAGGTMVRTMLVPASAVATEDTWNVIGLQATASDTFSVEKHFVPRAYAVSRDDPRERTYMAPLYHFPAMSLFAIGFSGVALGIARAMLDSFVALAVDKTPRNTRGVLRENHAVQAAVGEAEARLRAARLLVEHTAERIWQEVLERDVLTKEQRLEIRMASTHAIHEAKAVADIAYDWAGATAIFAGSAFERRFRDIHTVTQQVQGRKAHLQLMGAHMLGLEPDMAWA
jgi:alkylation response protein AidB-like acyl-CoA dehydrogenase